MSRNYPCKATIARGRAGGVNLEGVEVTVLTKAGPESCCHGPMHRIELPKGYPPPPEKCPTWMAGRYQLIFKD